MGLFGFIGSVISGVGSFLSEGLSLAVGALTGIAETIGNGIKSLCESVGSEGLALIGCIAMSILIPGFGIPEILSIIQIVAEVVKILGINTGEDTPEELGMKTEIAEKKPEDFDTISEYIKYLNEEVELEEGATEGLSDIDRVKYGAMGTALNIKAIEEKFDVSLSPDFLRDITIMKMTKEEVASYITEFKEKDISDMQELTDYLRDKPTETDKSVVGDSIVEVLGELYPELSHEEVEAKVIEMREQLKGEQ